jgi:nucleoside-diphosphate-sugar epimerase
MAKMIAMRLVLSNQKAFAEMGWRPSYRNIHDGLARLRAHAA